jgi:hypothetical protein
MFFETLENRSLFSVSLSAGILTVTGTNLNDSIVLSKNGAGQVSVNDDGAVSNFSWASVNEIIVNTLNGNDTVNSQAAITKPMVVHGGAGNDVFHGGGGNDSLFGGLGGIDYLYGGTGKDYIRGGTGENVIYGGIGNQTLIGGTGTNWIYCGTGNQYAYGGPGENVIDGGTGTDTLEGGSGTGTNWITGGTGTQYLYGGWQSENVLTGGNGNQIVYGGYSSPSNWIYGGTGQQKLHGNGGGYNYVYGGTGNQQLFGGRGYNYLKGGNGNDVLVSIGTANNDTLTGGSGFDSYWLDSEASNSVNASLAELLCGNVHRISSFYGGVSRNGWAAMAEPSDAGTQYWCGNDPLFAPAGPSQNDIYQGGVGDCYFLATLSATAKTDPNRIRNSVVDLGDGTYAVQFWSGGSPQYVRVDAELSIDSYGDHTYAGLGRDNSIWVPVIEKAFAAFRTGANTYASISTGWMYEAFGDLGSTSTNLWSWSSGISLLNYIEGELTAGKAVTIATPSTIIGGCPCVGSHAYMVDHVNYETINVGWFKITIPVSVVLRNPWGFDGVSDGSDPSDGYVTVSADQAFSNFDAVQSAYV